MWPLVMAVSWLNSSPSINETGACLKLSPATLASCHACPLLVSWFFGVWGRFVLPVFFDLDFALPLPPSSRCFLFFSARFPYRASSNSFHACTYGAANTRPYLLGRGENYSLLFDSLSFFVRRALLFLPRTSRSLIFMYEVVLHFPFFSTMVPFFSFRSWVGICFSQ